MKKTLLLICSISLTLGGCAYFQRGDTPASEKAESNPSLTVAQSRRCKEIKRQIMMHQSNLNADHAWARNTQLQELQDDYHEQGCE